MRRFVYCLIDNSLLKNNENSLKGFCRKFLSTFFISYDLNLTQTHTPTLKLVPNLTHTLILILNKAI